MPCLSPCGHGGSMKTVAVLFARADSNYKELEACDVYDAERDARTYDGPYPVVAHPPCRGWGSFAWRANVRPDERNLARLAVGLVRAFGGVLEHPITSSLWKDQRLPAPGKRDQYGGFTLPIDQHCWGHRARKQTLLYVVGIEPSAIPEMPISFGEPEFVIGDVGRAGEGTKRREIPKAEREHTPPELAKWLVALAEQCRVKA